MSRLAWFNLTISRYLIPFIEKVSLPSFHQVRSRYAGERHSGFTKCFRLCWYAAEKYLRDLKAKEEFSPRVLSSVEALADFLISEVRTMERGSEPARREAREQVPADRVKDAPSLARELRWRTRLAEGYNSDDDGSGRRRGRQENGSNHKRKREDAGRDEETRPLFRNFQPKGWEIVSEEQLATETLVVKMAKPVEGQKLDEVLADWSGGPQGVSDGEEVDVQRRKDVVMKYRRTARGIQRQRIERVWEEWAWRQ
jgi:hypothetical protein